MCDCLTALEWMNAVLDGEATPQQAEALAQHLAQCPACASLFHDLSALRDGSDALVVSAPEGFTSRVMEAVALADAPAKQKKVTHIRTWRSLGALAAVCALALLGSGALRYFQSAPTPPPSLPTPEAMTVVTPSPAATTDVESQSLDNLPLPIANEESPAPTPTATPAPTATATPTPSAPVPSARLFSVAPRTALATESPAPTASPSPSPVVSNRVMGGLPPVSAPSPTPTPAPVTPEQALDLVLERTNGDSGYTLEVDTLTEEGDLGYLVRLLDADGQVMDQSVLRYTGFSPNKLYYCFDWECEDVTMAYAVKLDGSAILWEGDVLDDGASFRAALEE